MNAEQSYYVTDKLESVDELREIFPLGEADAMNWCFLGTSGVHGSSTTLEEFEARAARGLSFGTNIDAAETHDAFAMYLTVLVVQPRLVRTLYGEIEIGLGDITFLRGLVRSTVAAVAKSQAGNL